MGAEEYHVLGEDEDKSEKLEKKLLFSRNVAAIYENNNDILYGEEEY
ncbi:MAG: hypothetical protein RAO94_11990 [Candidatus Stygibacter australis]|nr:hypothetical protein [Candidatus Stygibacter australis]MDP8323063.1 hypothetical protein [Candidatus Stygibacter australis]